MYILNILFRFSEKTGLFSGDDATAPPGADSSLRRSNEWLELKGAEPLDPNPPSFNPDVRNWERLGQAEALVLPTIAGSPDPANIGIRIAPHQGGGSLSNPTLQLAVTFGRPPRLHQPQASPFKDAAGCVIPTFISPPIPRNTFLPDGSPFGWFVHLGTVKIRPGSGTGFSKKKTHRYEFAIGVIVSDNGQMRYYGEDPEMDIGE